MAYPNLTDQQLLDRLTKYQTAYDDAVLGGGVGVIAGEGRRVEFTRSNSNAIYAEVRNMTTEAIARGLITGPGGGAIAVEIG